jgi:AAA domain
LRSAETSQEELPLIIWLNGAFGSAKTTLAAELHHRLPDAVIFDPEHVGYVLTQAVKAPTGDFQDLPSWRRLVVEHARALREFHAMTLIVPMTLVNRQYFDEIIGALRTTGEEVRHVFLDLPADVLRSRIESQVLVPGNPERDERARQFRLRNVARCVAAAKEQPDGTISRLQRRGMKRIFIAAMVAFICAGCGSSSSSSNPYYAVGYSYGQTAAVSSYISQGLLGSNTQTAAVVLQLCQQLETGAELSGINDGPTTADQLAWAKGCAAANPMP